MFSLLPFSFQLFFPDEETVLQVVGYQSVSGQSCEKQPLELEQTIQLILYQETQLLHVFLLE